MIRIAICDDSSQMIETLKQQVLTFIEQEKETVSLQTYENSSRTHVSHGEISENHNLSMAYSVFIPRYPHPKRQLCLTRIRRRLAAWKRYTDFLPSKKYCRRTVSGRPAR